MKKQALSQTLSDAVTLTSPTKTTRHPAARAIGQRLVLLRGRLSQEAYAAELGVHVNTLARYERGERLPNGAFFLQLMQAGANLHWLLTGMVLLNEQLFAPDEYSSQLGAQKAATDTAAESPVSRRSVPSRQ